ncbi:hypothetical protein GCM10010923_09160 [Blastomonas marina]|uniref:MalT-like TPR region domain-containing protein n=1 Tax=Blastomonas marina TaxID=1867408 RepID=A0ABQ1F8S2_9SPHN|nr:hypothetical protein GCM10010923_09160 [Blastomonas marina]
MPSGRFPKSGRHLVTVRIRPIAAPDFRITRWECDRGLGWYRGALLLVRYNDPQSQVGIRTMGEAASVLIRLGQLEEARDLLVDASEITRERLASAPEFDAVARRQLDEAGPIFLDRVRTDWLLSRAP